jgi:DNA-binding NarL/FixJ family response regulator
MSSSDPRLLAALAEAESLRQRMRASRDARVLKLLADGVSMSEAARRVGINVKTVRDIRNGART